MSSRSVSDIHTRAEGESLYIRYRSDANVNDANDQWRSQGSVFGGAKLLERRRREPPRGVRGHSPPEIF